MASSQYEEYATATGTSFKDIMHSTPLGGPPSRPEMPLHYDQFPEPSEHGSNGSDGMSIEIGRGGKRGTSKNYDDLSSNATFTFGNDHSQHEITGTPPIRPQANQRKSDSVLRKQASLRRATESARMRDAGRPVIATAKLRAVSDNLPRLNVEDDAPEPSLQTATFAIRGSRFTSSRHVSRSYSGIPSRFNQNEGLVTSNQTPRPPAAQNATVQSATHTANQSFMLPDIANLTELVSGVRPDGTPILRRAGVSRSRFTSVPQKPNDRQHIPVTGIPLLEEEKAIFASLQLANDRIAQLELEKTESQQRAEELECELVELRGRLNTAAGHSDSALGSDEESVELRTSREEATRLQTKIKALQNRLEKMERKASNSEITVSRVTRERNTLVAEIGSAYYQLEEAAKENDTLKMEIERLRFENAELRESLASRPKSQTREGSSREQTRRSRSRNQQADVMAIEEDEAMVTSRSSRSRPAQGVERRQERTGIANDSRQDEEDSHATEQLDQASARDLATRIEREIQKHRLKATEKEKESRHTNNLRFRSRSQRRRSSTLDHVSDSRRRVSVPTGNTPDVQDAGDLTQLSDIDMGAVGKLRRKLEEEHRAKRSGRTSAPAELENVEPTVSSNRPAVPRKSSLRDLTNAFGGDTGRFSVHGAIADDSIKITKTVRVQSPHSSQDIPDPEGQDTDIGDTSIMSNTSRRRRRTSSMEGMTSAFIIPDITMHTAQTQGKGSRHSCIEHKAGSCTICAASRNEEVEISAPIPVTERAELADLTDATIRPVQTPAAALAAVIKNLEDEIKHLKLSRDQENCRYNQHEPAISKRRRQSIKSKIERLTNSIELRSDQVYQLYDVLEGQKQQGKELKEQEIEETLTSIGIDPAELSGRVGRSAPAALNDVEGLSGDESDELPWEGISDVASEDIHGFGK